MDILFICFVHQKCIILFHWFRRWYTPEVEFIPQMRTIAVQDMDERQTPDFAYREPFWMEAFDKDWLARNRCNSARSTLDAVRGGKINWPGGHTFFPMMPPDSWFENHPEYYSLTGNMRNWEFAQLCLTNPEVMRIISALVLKEMESRPDDVYFEVSPNDWSGWCECGMCREIDKKNDAHSGTLVHFVNNVGERTGRRYPDKYISTRACGYTEKAPLDVSPRSNVVITLCNNAGCGSQPLAIHPGNIQFRTNMMKWAEKTKNIIIWDYWTNFSHFLLPYPVLNALRADIPWFKKYNVIGLFMQGCYQTTGASFAELQMYIQAKMMWNSGRDMNRIMDEFLFGYFGKAAVPIRAYIDLLHKKVHDENICFSHGVQPGIQYLSRDILAKAGFFFDEAERLAESVEIGRRIAKWRLSLRYAELIRPIEHEIKGTVYGPVQAGLKYADAQKYQEFISNCRELGITNFNEPGIGNSDAGYEFRGSQIEANIGAYRILTIENKFLKLSIVPDMGGRILQIEDVKRGIKLLAPGDVDDYEYPGSGGYHDKPARFEHFDCEIDNTSDGYLLTMTANLRFHGAPDALRLVRRIALPDNRPAIEFEVILTGLKPVTLPCFITASPLFLLGKAENLDFGFIDSEGSFIKYPLPEPDEKGRKIYTFKSAKLPGNRAVIINRTNNTGIIDAFNSIELSRTTLGMDEKGRSIIELESRKKALNEGDSISIRHSYRILYDLSLISKRK